VLSVGTEWVREDMVIEEIMGAVGDEIEDV
jgi:hypothetical protein